MGPISRPRFRESDHALPRDALQTVQRIIEKRV